MMEDVYFLDRVLTAGVSSTADRLSRSERKSTLFSETMSKETHFPYPLSRSNDISSILAKINE
jgi:hypothetical protein